MLSCLCICAVCAYLLLQKSEVHMRSSSPGVRKTDNWELPRGCQELNPSPLLYSRCALNLWATSPNSCYILIQLNRKFEHNTSFCKLLFLWMSVQSQSIWFNMCCMLPSISNEYLPTYLGFLSFHSFSYSFLYLSNYNSFMAIPLANVTCPSPDIWS